MFDPHFPIIKAAYFSVCKSSLCNSKTSSMDLFVKQQPHLFKFGILHERTSYTTACYTCVWNAFRKKMCNFFSLLKRFLCYHSAVWGAKKKLSLCLLCIKAPYVDFSKRAFKKFKIRPVPVVPIEKTMKKELPPLFFQTTWDTIVFFFSNHSDTRTFSKTYSTDHWYAQNIKELHHD